MTMDVTAIANINDSGYVKKANSLIQLNRFIGEDKGQSMSLLESKVFTFALSYLDQDKSDLQPVTFSIRDFWLECGIEPSSTKYFTLIADALDKLRSRRGWVIFTDQEGKKKKALVGMIEMPEYSEDERTCTVNFNPKLAPALLQLKGNFSRYHRRCVMQLESKYGFFLYDLLCSYEYMHKPLRFSFEDLAERLDATTYDRPANFKMRVIDFAVKDINEHSKDLNISYTIEKTGRKLTHVVFTLTRLVGPCASVANEAALEEEPHEESATAKIKTQINYDTIAADIQSGLKPYDIQALNLIVDVMSEVYAAKQKTYSINKRSLPVKDINARFNELDMIHVEYVLDSIGQTQTTIKNPRAYILSALYNAPMTMDIYYTSRVNADLNNGKQDYTGKRQLCAEEYEAIQRILRDDA